MLSNSNDNENATVVVRVITNRSNRTTRGNEHYSIAAVAAATRIHKGLGPVIVINDTSRRYLEGRDTPDQNH